MIVALATDPIAPLNPDIRFSCLHSPAGDD